MSNPYLQNGKWYIPKDPDDERFYTADVAQDLTDSNTTVASVATIVSGVTVVTAAVFNGSKLTVKLGGLDITPNGQNFCTFRVTCANSEIFDRTIWFVREDH